MGQVAERIEPDNTVTGFLGIIERAASNPQFDPDKLDRLLQMQERILERNAQMAFNSAMQAAQSEMPKVHRDAQNRETRSTYATLEQVVATVAPIATKNGFSMSFGTADSPLEGHYRVVCDVAHIEGHTRRYHADVPADGTGLKGNANKTRTHAFGSSLSYGRRYLTLMIFNVATSDDDDGNAAQASASPILAEEAGECITEVQCARLWSLINEAEADIKRFCEFFKISALPELLTSQFANAVALLEEKKKTRR